MLIPVTPLDGGPGGGLLEVIAERDGPDPRGGGRPRFRHLRGHGLGAAVAAAERALAVADLSPPRRRALPDPAGIAPPVVYLANPMPGLSNALGAALGLALAVLMVEGRCPGARLVASGRLVPGATAIQPTLGLGDKLRLVLTLGPQPAPLPFLVPTATEDGAAVAERYAGLIGELERRNVHARPVAGLEAAVAACRALAGRRAAAAR
ncbi:MAG TPA: hypothetical protein VFG47_08710 [Geminicoccaceae bacterium]|nr:hypothetical protein [Geminicoccaceae bacterium]